MGPPRLWPFVDKLQERLEELQRSGQAGEDEFVVNKLSSLIATLKKLVAATDKENIDIALPFGAWRPP